MWYGKKKCDNDISTIFWKSHDISITIYHQTIFWGLVTIVTTWPVATDLTCKYYSFHRDNPTCTLDVNIQIQKCDNLVHVEHFSPKKITKTQPNQSAIHQSRLRRDFQNRAIHPQLSWLRDECDRSGICAILARSTDPHAIQWKPEDFGAIRNQT